MSYGMGYDEFWEGDLDRVYSYLEAGRERDKRKLDSDNFIAYLSGRYVYEALLAVAPVLVSYPKKNARILPYPDKPVELRASDDTPSMTPEQQQEMDAYLAYRNMKYLEMMERQKGANMDG